MKDNRTIILKSNVSVDDFQAMDDARRAAKKSMSTYIRDCCLGINVKSRRRQTDRPSLAPFQAKLAPGRSTRGFARMNS
jgi:hypothetical protein